MDNFIHESQSRQPPALAAFANINDKMSCCGVTAVREIDDTIPTDQTLHFCSSRPVPRKLSSLTGIFP